MQMPKKVKKIWDTVTTVLVVLVVVFAVFLMGSRLVGLQVFNVISGSMEPTYSVGDLLYVKSVDPDSVKVGDPITFVLNEELVVATHRVVAIDGENRLFTTKGDANETEDAAPVQDASGELTEAQLKMVEEITQRYLAAQPKPRRRSSVTLAITEGSRNHSIPVRLLSHRSTTATATRVG